MYVSPRYNYCDLIENATLRRTHRKVKQLWYEKRYNYYCQRKRRQYVLFSASSKHCQHDNSWTAALSLMKFCMNMYLDNLQCSIIKCVKLLGGFVVPLGHLRRPNCDFDWLINQGHWSTFKVTLVFCVFLACMILLEPVGLDSRNVVR